MGGGGSLAGKPWKNKIPLATIIERKRARMGGSSKKGGETAGSGGRGRKKPFQASSGQSRPPAKGDIWLLPETHSATAGTGKNGRGRSRKGGEKR